MFRKFWIGAALVAAALAAQAQDTRRARIDVDRYTIDADGDLTAQAGCFLYEAGGAFGLSLFARLAAHADFRSVLAGFYRPGALRLALAPLVTAFWRNRGRCAHRLPEHWCRRREREIREVALGRIG